MNALLDAAVEQAARLADGQELDDAVLKGMDPQIARGLKRLALLHQPVLAHGYTWARCPGCTAELLVAYSCKGRGVRSSCATKRMAATAAHLVEAVIPRVPMRQRVLAFPKRLRPALRNHAALAIQVLLPSSLSASSANCAAALRYRRMRGELPATLRFGAERTLALH